MFATQSIVTKYNGFCSSLPSTKMKVEAGSPQPLVRRYSYDQHKLPLAYDEHYVARVFWERLQEKLRPSRSVMKEGDVELMP